MLGDLKQRSENKLSPGAAATLASSFCSHQSEEFSATPKWWPFPAGSQAAQLSSGLLLAARRVSLLSERLPIPAWRGSLRQRGRIAFQNSNSHELAKTSHFPGGLFCVVWLLLVLDRSQGSFFKLRADFVCLKPTIQHCSIPPFLTTKTVALGKNCFSASEVVLVGARIFHLFSVYLVPYPFCSDICFAQTLLAAACATQRCWFL